MKKTTSEKIAALLERGGAITTMQAIKRFGCTRLAARIHDLRATGMDIKSTPYKTRDGKMVAKYTLA